LLPPRKIGGKRSRRDFGPPQSALSKTLTERVIRKRRHEAAEADEFVGRWRDLSGGRTEETTKWFKMGKTQGTWGWH